MPFHAPSLARRAIPVCIGAAFAASAGTALAQGKPLQGQVVKMAWIDPLSGLMAPVGNNQLNSWKFAIEKFNAMNPAGVKFEIIGLDNKLSPTESLNALKSATDQGIRYIIQGNGSSVALALIDAINKYNERNPGKEVIYLNEAAVDPDLTNSKCSYWHYRFDADTTMKMEAMTTYMKDQKDIKKVYLLNQNYSHGQQVAKYAKEYLKRKRPDIEIVGEDLHPLAQVRDFAPYIAKIKAAGADSVITGNWGSDLALLVKAAVEGGYNGKFFTYYTGVTGTPTALGHNGDGKVYQVAYSPRTWAALRPVGTRVQAEVQRRLLHRLDLPHPRGARPGDGTGQVDRSGQGRRRARRPQVEEHLRRRSRDAQVRPPAAAAALHHGVAPVGGKFTYSIENTGMTLATVAEYPPTCRARRPAAR
jgi:branched-chain amino acid transport system substrate-binding protein